MPMRERPEKREEKERVRSSLLHAALLLGATHGFASLGLREVARAANIAPTSFYRHFADMLELGEALVADLVEPLLGELAACMTPGDRAASARALSAAVLELAEHEPALLRFVIAERAGAFPPLRKALAQRLERLERALADDRICADTSLALLLDGSARALDAASAERAEVGERLAQALAFALEPRSP